MAVSLEGDSITDNYKELPPRTDGRPIVFKMPSFTLFDGTFMAISMVTFAVDIGTDLNLVVRYFISGSVIWAALTLLLVLLPAVIVMIMSMRWHLADGHRVTKIHWIAHVTLWGILHRYILLFKTGVKARHTQDLTDFDDLYRQQSDLCMLRLFESFMESAPQLILQLYIMMSHDDFSTWTAITAASSLVSLGWGIAAYTKAMRNARLDKHKMTISGLILQTVWRVGMIAARVASLALVATVLEGWLLVIMGIHMTGMFFWVVCQKTGFSTTKWEETIFNFIMAVTYCICFFNLKEGHARWRMLTFYTVIVIENSAFILIYYIFGSHGTWLRYTALGVVFGGMLLGLTCLVLYYRYFHPMGPLNPFEKWQKYKAAVNEKADGCSSEEGTPRSDICSSKHNSLHRSSMRRNIKSIYPPVPKSAKCILSAAGVSLKSSPASEAPVGKASPQVSYQKQAEVMCSVQDLLANVSCSIDMNASDVANTSATDKGALANATPESTMLDNNNPTPSSLERSVTRELNIRLSSSDFTRPLIAETTDSVCDGSNSQDTPRSVESHNSSQGTSCYALSGHSSPNSVGVPHKQNSSTHNSLKRDLSTSILRTSIRKSKATVSDSELRTCSLPHLTHSAVDITSRSCQDAELDSIEKVKPPNVELAVIDRMHIIEVESSGMSSENQSDYENIYENQGNNDRDLPPKPANLVQNLDETQTTQSSIPHDYENICSVNINRAMWGVRHWKTYSDIEDRIHDSSTVRERLKLLDSTLASSHYSDYSMIKAVQAVRSASIMEDCDSVLSRSLPDLSILKLETCFEDPAEEVEETNCIQEDTRLLNVLNQLRANRPFNKSSSVDDIPNYETIWVGDIEKPDSSEMSSQMDSLTSKSSLVVTIGDVRAKESLCNLYYSTMSDLSFRYYSERMRNNCSSRSRASHASQGSSLERSEMIRAISVPDNKTLSEVQELIEEERHLEQEGKNLEHSKSNKAQINFAQHVNTPLTSEAQSRPRRKFSVLRERFENPWTPRKSPMQPRQPTQRRNSFQDRTAKALQAGMKVFRRPRVHVITPKKSEDNNTPRLKSPFRSKNTTPTPPAIKISADQPVENKIEAKVDNEAKKLPSYVTPQRRITADIKAIKSTPKTSTPDNTKTPKTSTPDDTKPKKVTKIPADTNRVQMLKDGPKTSTPEGNKTVQMSILSSVSSVVPSPPDCSQRMSVSDQRLPLKIEISDQKLALRSEISDQRLPLSENLRHDLNSLKSSSNLLVQAKSGAITKKINTERGLISAKSAVNLGSSRTADEENVCNFPSVTPKLGKHTSQSLQALNSSSQNQAMFLGFLGLPQIHETKSTVNIVESVRSPSSHNVSISRSIIFSSPQSPRFNMQKSTLSPNSKIFSRRI